jgi:hypothetical protein
MILLYNKSWEEHVHYVDKVLLQLLEEQQLYAKLSKCAFWVEEVEYLGHIVSHEGVKVDPNKLKAMREWPIPKTLKKLRGFLVIDRLLRQVCQDYGKKVTALTTLLKKGAFSWTGEENKYFENLRRLCVQFLS